MSLWAIVVLTILVALNRLMVGGDCPFARGADPCLLRGQAVLRNREISYTPMVAIVSGPWRQALRRGIITGAMGILRARRAVGRAFIGVGP